MYSYRGLALQTLVVIVGISPGCSVDDSRTQQPKVATKAATKDPEIDTLRARVATLEERFDFYERKQESQKKEEQELRNAVQSLRDTLITSDGTPAPTSSDRREAVEEASKRVLTYVKSVQGQPFNGSFMELGDGRWQENASERLYSFLEQDRNSGWIYLRDDYRDINIRLPLNGGWCAYQGGPLHQDGSWTNLYVVQKLRDDDHGRRIEYWWFDPTLFDPANRSHCLLPASVAEVPATGTRRIISTSPPKVY